MCALASPYSCFLLHLFNNTISLKSELLVFVFLSSFFVYLYFAMRNEATPSPTPSCLRRFPCPFISCHLDRETYAAAGQGKGSAGPGRASGGQAAGPHAPCIHMASFVEGILDCLAIAIKESETPPPPPLHPPVSPPRPWPGGLGLRPKAAPLRRAIWP